MNGDPTIGRQGSIPPAAVFENPQREIVNIITRSRITPTDADLQQLTKAVRSQFLNYVQDTGSENFISGALDPPLTDYTVGLTLRVRVAHRNTGPVRININNVRTVQVRKMDGAQLNEDDLPALCIATLVFDGQNFQLTNFGGAAAVAVGPPNVYEVKIPYVVDEGTVNNVEAPFNPPVPDLAAGHFIAVKIKNTNSGPTMIRLRTESGFVTKELKPNGGGDDGFALQGDLHEGDIVLFFYDGNSFWFNPNPEIDDFVQYGIRAASGGVGTVGVVMFDSVANAIAAIRRKTIGATGYVEFLFQGGTAGNPAIFHGPMTVSHPSGDRIGFRGVTFATRPSIYNFQRTGWNGADDVPNRTMLRSRYGTEIQVPFVGAGITTMGFTNVGPGRVALSDVLITGQQIPVASGGGQNGIHLGGGCSLSVSNVALWGCFIGALSAGNFSGNGVSACGCYVGFQTTAVMSGSFYISVGNSYGYSSVGGDFHSFYSIAWANWIGFYAQNGARIIVQWGTALGGVWDVYSSSSSSVACYRPSLQGYGSSTPLWNTVGNGNAINHLVDFDHHGPLPAT